MNLNTLIPEFFLKSLFQMNCPFLLPSKILVSSKMLDRVKMLSICKTEWKCIVWWL